MREEQNMRITKFDAVATILGRERNVKYDGVHLQIEVDAGEVAPLVNVLEGLVVRERSTAPEPPPDVKVPPTPSVPVAASPLQEPAAATEVVETAPYPASVQQVLDTIDQPYEADAQAADSDAAQ